eukprot:CAMPEP_0115339998 /NCGR_PEP_ID=MMETSP0270-20121206/90915_1 /TAXON_ID=71861 /ORGANISM="Scrippsiella trochoidea, Strain CCMP3099" /LENGTH=142 /DNA_ID=CAMNT_0002761429 /DNA_START=179 /DNA_END=605 /DNA_ORIENTATION=+
MSFMGKASPDIEAKKPQMSTTAVRGWHLLSSKHGNRKHHYGACENVLQGFDDQGVRTDSSCDQGLKVCDVQDIQHRAHEANVDIGLDTPIQPRPQRSHLDLGQGFHGAEKAVEHEQEEDRRDNKYAAMLKVWESADMSAAPA